jgi:glucosyl-3-phosphoglycerate synthase
MTDSPDSTRGVTRRAATAALPAPNPLLRAAVVVPARDEAKLIERCLVRLCGQRAIKAEEYEIIVVLDGCIDATPAVVRAVALATASPSVHILELGAAVGVGRARRIGMDAACERLLAVARPGGLIATTDADTVVAPDWLAAQLALVDSGARAIGGYIELDPAETAALAPEALRVRADRGADRLADVRAGAAGATVDHHHFSGASLALTAEAYEACGGLPVRGALEDKALADALAARGVTIHRSGAVRVQTSARMSGRAPRGLAGDLAQTHWRSRRVHSSADYPLERLLEAKHATIALVLPAREVATTIGKVAREASRLVDAGLLDEVVVVDAASHDRTAETATAEGVEVMQENDLLPQFGPVLGKGDAMWRALSVVESDLVAFVDTDTVGFEATFITGLLGPLLCDPGVRFVKAAFRRPFRVGDEVTEHGGGRVTEILARPLLNLHAPELGVFDQPLAGETAAERELLEQIPFSAGYGIEIGMLIDVWRLAGLDAMAQVDLGVRQNRHQPLRELSAMAYAVLVAAQTRFLGSEFADAWACGRILLPPFEGEAFSESRSVTVEERPPLAQIAVAEPRRLLS